jgi:hypothetical protein
MAKGVETKTTEVWVYWQWSLPRILTRIRFFRLQSTIVLPLFGVALTSVADQFNALNGGNPDAGFLTAGFWTASFPTAVPESTTWAMMISGFCGLGFLAHHRRKNLTLLNPSTQPYCERPPSARSFCLTQRDEIAVRQLHSLKEFLPTERSSGCRT